MRTAPELKAMFPEVDSYVRLSKIGMTTVKSGDKMVNESLMCSGRQQPVRLLQLPHFGGRRTHGHQKKNTMAISRELSEKFFGSPQEAIGQIVEVAGTQLRGNAGIRSGCVRNAPSLSCVHQPLVHQQGNLPAVHGRLFLHGIVHLHQISARYGHSRIHEQTAHFLRKKRQPLDSGERHLRLVGVHFSSPSNRCIWARITYTITKATPTNRTCTFFRGWACSYCSRPASTT